MDFGGVVCAPSRHEPVELPQLLAANRRNNPKLMFWVIKHGVNMTAMPSFGKTQTDQTIWQSAAFLYDARGITKERYDTLVQSSK